MAVETSIVARLTATAPRAKTLFAAALVLATVIPFFSVLNAPVFPSIIPAIEVLFLFAGTHVLATGYLLTDPMVRQIFAAHPVKLIVVPAALFAGAMILFGQADSSAFAFGVLILSLYQAWHFGAQNIGVAAFVSLSDRGRSLAPTERVAIRIGVVVGMLGVLKIMAPTYQIGENYMLLDPTTVRVIEVVYQLGFFAAIPVTGLALWIAIKAWRQAHYLFGMSIFLSVTFLFTMYLSQSYILGFVSFTAAHGLQYLVFLFAHSLNRRKPEGARSIAGSGIAPAALLMSMLAGYFVWQDAPAVKTLDWPSIGIGVILSLGLVHFWLDRSLWRMRDKDCARWMKSRYSFVFTTASH
jgi:hypothetical protein